MSKRSKLLSLILRHDPGKAGITLDPHGWIDIPALLAGVARMAPPMDADELQAIVAADQKQRFTISPDGLRIRAAQGHSVAVDLGLSPSVPPSILYHGTARANLNSIFASGLLPRTRRHVHLSPDVDTARRVGRRHGEEVVLRVDTAAMHAAGTSFWQADNGVWLTESVPALFLTMDADADRT